MPSDAELKPNLPLLQSAEPALKSTNAAPASASASVAAAEAVNVNRIVAPAPKSPVLTPLPIYIPGRGPLPGPQEWAPAWFYSALNWLGKSYYDASSVRQSFSTYMAGSDVDPYTKLGSTRLFVIFYQRESFWLSLAADANSDAPLTLGNEYPNTDAGIRQMYIDLSASAIFSAVKFCYIPGRLGSDLGSNVPGIAATAVTTLRSGYDPASGLRAMVLGSAVAQAVPLDDFLKTHNEQIYDEDPRIVPVVSALVYDVTQHNVLGATTFGLPVFYSREQVSTGTYFVNRLGTSITNPDGTTSSYGQTALFPGGPGYHDASATALTLKTESVAAGDGVNFTTYNFTTARATSVATLGSKVETGAVTLTYSGPAPSTIFRQQRIIGFYQDSTWQNSLGIPIYDFGSANANFTATSSAPSAPAPIYSPASGFLNGGSLQNVLRKLAQATYMYSTDQLVSILDTAIAVNETSNGVGLSVTTADLDFDLSSTPSASVVDQLSIPVLATVTTTPAPVVIPSPRRPGLFNATHAEVAVAAPAPSGPTQAPPITNPVSGAQKPPIIGTIEPINLQQIGGGANNPSQNQPGPVTAQVSLSAFIPREALTGTGITNVEIGTLFPQQDFGAGATLQAETAGTTVNLMHTVDPALMPITLQLASTGVNFKAGISYVVSLTGSSFSVRGSDETSSSGTLPSSIQGDATHIYVGAMVYAASATSIVLYPLLPLTLPAPAVGTHSVLQGQAYSVRLTFGDANSQYDIVDATRTIVDSNISVPNPQPADKSTPQKGDLYFGSFIGGASTMTVWSVPVFLTVTPAQVAAAGFNGDMTLSAEASGVPGYQLKITDSSLFVYSNINVDTSTVGSVSSSNVYLASAVINSSPDDLSPQAFAPCKLLMGIIRQAQMGTVLKYVFIPENDSVVIGGKRYLLSVINLEANQDDPNSRPYPPVFWPQTRYWQFANRHNPYLAVEYTGAAQTDRINRAQSDVARIGVATSNAQEPMQMYLDTNNSTMTVWPIYAFPYASSSQSVDQGQLKTITSTILQILGTSFTQTTSTSRGPLDSEQITLPGALLQNNPYTADTATTANPNPAASDAILMNVPEPALSATTVNNLSPGFLADTTFLDAAAKQNFGTLQSQVSEADLATTKSLLPTTEVVQDRFSLSTQSSMSFARLYQPIFGFSVYNPATGEAYIVEVVNADLDVPDQLPNATQNVTYDPYYVRVVFLNTLTCYNMSIIVPSMVRDQYGNFAHQATAYENVLSKTDELGIGYMYSLFDQSNNFDQLKFTPFPATLAERSVNSSQSYIFTNLPYTTQQNTIFNPGQLFASASANALISTNALIATRELARSFDVSHINYNPFRVPTPYFVCRRQNWNADCHLMQATHPQGKSVYLAFGGGDLVPFRLDAPFTVDKRQPTHMNKFTHSFADKQYDNAQTISIANKPYVVGVTTSSGVAQYTNFSINSTAGTATLTLGANQNLTFPEEIYVAGQASATQISIAAINKDIGANFSDTGSFMNLGSQGNVIDQQFQLITYNNLVYLIRAVANVKALGTVGGLGITSGLLIDTYVPTANGNLALAQAARYKRSGMRYFGSTYTPTTFIDTLDTLDFTSITGDTFYAPTVFIPIKELDTTKGFIANLSNFLGEQFWTFIYSEIVAQQGTTVNGVSYPNGFNLDNDGKPILSLQKLHFIYDPLAVLFTPNDLTHKYPLLPKQQILALTNGQLQEGICWRTANLQPQRLPPTNISAQQLETSGLAMDQPNIVYSSHNRPVITSVSDQYLGMSVNNVVALSGTVYNIEESALSGDQTGSQFISQVSSTTNMLVGVLFDYDNNDQGTLTTYDQTESTKGIVFLNGYLSASGYSFSSPDHFDVNDVLPSQVPLLDEVADIFGWDTAFYNMDASLPRQFWSLTYDSFTAPGLPNYIANVPPPPADPTFANRTRSLVLSLQNPVRPTNLGLIDTYNSVVSANLHLQNGVTGAIFLSKKADRDVASIGSNQTEQGQSQLFGLPTKYDFFIFSRDHYMTLTGASFELIDQGYAMCLVDDGTGTGTKVAKYYIDSDGNYYELFNYVLYSPSAGVLETSAFTVKVTLGAPANLSASPIIPETPNNVNPQDVVAQINKVSNLIYAAFGPSSSGQPPAFIPIQAVSGAVQAAPIIGAPGPNGYSLNVVSSNRQPVQISQIYSANVTYSIAGSTTVVPISAKTGKAVPFYGSLSHGLDKQVSVPLLQSKDLSSFIPRTTVPPGPAAGVYGGNGLGALIGTQLSVAFQGAGAIPPAIASDPTPGTTMKADDSIFYTFNAVSNSVMDSTGKSATAAGGLYFVDETDPTNPIYGVVTLPKFTLNGNTYTVVLSTTLSDGVTSRYSLVVGGKSYLFGPDNAHVTADRTQFTFNPISGGAYTVTYAAVDAPAQSEAPSPITLTPFSIAAGGLSTIVDVFNNPGGLQNIVLGVVGRQYTYDPVHGTVTVTAGTTSTVAPLQTGLVFASNSGYAYVIGINAGAYTANGSQMFPYSASTSGSPASYALMTAPQMFTLGGNFYTFNQDANGNYLSVTGNQQTYPINPYQFSINGQVYIINTNVQPNTVVGGGNVYSMTAGNTQFILNGVQYTIALKGGSLNGATISGQFNITQGNVVIIENFVYELDIPNGQIVGNGNTYPLTTSGFTYTITSANQSFTVTTEPNATTVTIGNIDYLINNTTVVGDGIIYPILAYRTFVDGAQTFNIGIDDTVSVAPPLPLSGSAPFTRSTFTDSGQTYTVNDSAAFDGANYHLISGTVPQFTAGTLTYQLRNDGIAINAGPAKTYIATTGPLSPNQFTFGSLTLFFGRSQDIAAFDGSHYFAITNNQFTDSNTGLTYTISGNTAVHEGNSYEIFSNLGQGAYFEVPGGPTYFVNVAVADTGTPNGDIFHVFPISGGQFTIPLEYTITVSGSTVTISAVTFSAPTVVGTLTASSGSLTGGYFEDPVTKIVYECVVDAGTITFVDSSNTIYPFPASGAPNTLIASVVVSTGVSLAVDNESTPAIYPITNNQFIVGTTTYKTNVPVAYQNSTGPYFPMTNGRFIVPGTAPQSNLAYTIGGNTVVKGYVISEDDEFSADGNIVYTVNAVNVVKATNQATLSGAEPNQTLTAGSLTYSLNTSTSQASIQPAGLDYNTATKQFAVSYNGLSVTYTIGATAATDSRHPTGSFPLTVSGSTLTFTDTITGVTFKFDSSGNNPITAAFVYNNHFFIDTLIGATYYIDEADNRVEVLSYVPETTQYAFTPAGGTTYLIHYNKVNVVFPVVAGANVNVGVATVGSDTFAVEVDQVQPVGGGPAIPTNANSFEINGDLYTITGTPSGANYSSCHVVGAGIAPVAISATNTFKLTDPNVTYSIQLDASNLPSSITASFNVSPSRDLINVNDDVYLITYNTVSTGSLLGQGQASIAITNSSFTLTNPFDTTKAKFIFDDLNIYDAGSVVGQFTAYLMPTFFLGAATYTLNTTTQTITDNNRQPHPLLNNPAMFSINGFNYVLDTNRVPHAVIGNNNVSPLSTDVTVLSGHPTPNSTFTLNGQIYAFVEDSLGNLLAITGTKTYMIAQPALTFKLDSSLIFTLNATPPAAGNYAGTIVPIGTITAGTTVLNLYPGVPESGNADFFMYKNVLYTLVKSGSKYVAVQKTYSVYASQPAPTQQQLAVFNLNGTTYLVTDGNTTGVGTAAGINPGTMWARTSVSNVETQFGLVYGFAAQPTNVIQSASGLFQFQTTDANGNNILYDVLYTAGSNANMVKVDVPASLPTFVQSWPFNFVTAYPLTFETGGYNAFTTFVSETSSPSESFAGAYRTPVISTDQGIDTLLGSQGDFSVEFWHSLSLTPVEAYHPFTYSASTSSPLVYFVDVDFDSSANIFVRINNSVMSTTTTQPMFLSRWRHFALTYAQPYVILCQGAGFEVKQATNYNFSADFSIGMTFAASDVNSLQGLVYKGLGSDNSSPQLAMSYRVAVHNGAVSLTLTDADGNVSQEFFGPAVLQPGQFYQAIVVKKTSTLAGKSGSSDPYALPFDPSELGSMAQNGINVNVSSLPSNGGPIKFSNVAQADSSSTPDLQSLLNNLTGGSGKSYDVTISVRTVNDDGTFGNWTSLTSTQSVGGDSGLNLKNTGSAHLLIGSAYDDYYNTALPLGTTSNPGNIRELYLFNGAIDPTGIHSSNGLVDIANASSQDLIKAGLIGHWEAQYDPNGVVNNLVDDTAVALSLNMSLANLAPLTGHEFEGASLYIDGNQMPLTLVSGTDIPSSMPAYSAGSSLLKFNAGTYRLEEISMWSMCRQPYQVIDDMFGRLIPSNEPFLVVYLSGSFQVKAMSAPLLPMAAYIDNIQVKNAVTKHDLAFTAASLDLVGSPAVGTCGPLVTPNLYTPPGVALTVCDTPPDLTTYSVTFNTVSGSLAGEVNEVYVYVRNHVLTLYAGKKVGDLVLTWVSQEQGDVQLMGYIEGAPPCPMANLTNKSTYAGATSITFTTPTSVSLKYLKGDDPSDETKWSLGGALGPNFGIGTTFSPFGFGLKTKDHNISIELDLGASGSWASANTTNNYGTQNSSTAKMDESHKYTVKMQGTMSPYTGDLFMSSLNTLTTPSTTAGNPSSKTAILPNPNLGGFTTSNPAGQLPKTAPTEEKFGQRMYAPSPYGIAFVTSQTLDVYQETLLQTNTVFGFVRVPDPQIPRDLNIVSFRMSSKYIRPGCLDGVVGYVYNSATLPSGAQTYTTSTGEMAPLYDGNFSQGEVGHSASYMRVVEAYQIKKQIDQESSNTLAIYQTAWNGGKPTDSPTNPNLIPAMDFYDEYVWSSRGGTQEVKHSYSTTFDQVYTTSTVTTNIQQATFNLKVTAAFFVVGNIQGGWQHTYKDTLKYSYNTTATQSFDVTASFDGIETDTQMRYACNNDAHFVMNFNSMFNPNNQSGLNLVIGSDGLVYKIVPSVSSGAGLPVSDNLDTTQTYTQPQPAYTTGNADGLTGSLEPYDRPGKTNLFRTYVFYLQPSKKNADDFWNTVIDPVWLANSSDPDAEALRSASNGSVPWRLLYRVTYSERFLPPISTEAVVVPQITPVMAVPVLNPASDFLYQNISQIPRPAHNPANDIEANVVLAAPTASGLSAGTNATNGPNIGKPIPPNNVIPFDLVKSTSPIVNWGDSANAKIVSQLLTSVLGLNAVPMTAVALPGSTKIADILDPVKGGPLYSVYTDPNGLTVNVPVDFGITVYQDVNGNPIQYFDGKSYHSLQADYIASPDGTVMYYIQPPSTYDQSSFDLTGDYDLFGHPGDEWRYFLVSGMSANMTAEPTVNNYGPFFSSTGGSGYTGLTIADAQRAGGGANQVQGYVLVQGVLQWPNLNTNAETFSDVLVYKAMSLLDTFPIGDPEVLMSFLAKQYPSVPFTGNDEISLVFARNVISYFNSVQLTLLPE